MSLFSFSDWRLARRLSVCLLCALLCFLVPRPVSAQSGNPSEPPNLIVSLEQAEQTLTQLVQRLAERQRQVSDLQTSLQKADARLIDLAASLATLQGQLEAEQESLSKSQADLAETSSSLDSLSTRYDELDQAWQSYRQEMRGQVAGLERLARMWRVAGISGWIAAIIATLIASLVAAVR